MLRSGRGTYVPGFWSWKGLVSTVLTLMIAIVWGGNKLRERMKKEEQCFLGEEQSESVKIE
jgi:hypothetical protein